MDDKGTITSTSTSSDNADNAKSMQGTAYAILIIISISHFLNDMIQSVVPSIYPMIKEDFSALQILSVDSPHKFVIQISSCNGTRRTAGHVHPEVRI